MSARLDQLSPVKREAYERLRNRERARVTLREGAGPVGLVLVHPVGGSLGCYLPLLRELPFTGPVVGFGADRLLFDCSIPELAREYLAALEDGVRWCFTGWSFGGAVAFEMARLAGPRSVAVLLDTDRPVEPDGSSPALSETTIRQFFADDLARLSVSSPDIDSPDIDTELAERFEIYLAYTRALAGYEPGTHDGPTFVVRAERPPGVPIPWRQSCSDLTERHVPGADHYTLLAPPHLAVPLATITEGLSHVR
jgi:thioesterase domain-containing protein